jgi:hypothetical protein
MPRSFSAENLAGGKFFSFVSSCGFKPEHYNERHQRRAMTTDQYTKVLDGIWAIKDFDRAR